MAALPKAEFHPTTLLDNTDICRNKGGKKAHKHAQPHILCIIIQDFYKDGCFVALFCKTVPWARTRVWYTLLHRVTSSPTSYCFKSLTFMLINAALAQELHCKEGKSPHAPVTWNLPSAPASSQQKYPSLSRQGKNNKWESEKAVRSTAKKSELFLKKRPSLRKAANQTRSRGCFPRVNRVLIDTAYVCSMQPSTRLSRADRITQTHSLWFYAFRSPQT